MNQTTATSAGKVRYKRRQILSNPRVQLRIIGVFFVLAVVYAATGYFVVTSVLRRFANDVLALSLSGTARNDVVILLRNHMDTLNIQMGLFIFFSIFILTMAAVLLSHRIGGPMYQLRKYLHEMARGETEAREIRFRKGDCFHDLADAFNEFQRSHGILPRAKPDKSQSNPNR
ncbi:MAG: hypothetical protein N2255_06300 [Kiritimatiellae bacterium]|nr:hypothetical protein [Kiritimatiellia bacterium]